MTNKLEYSKKLDYSRYQHYFGEIWRYYEKPIARVSIALLLTIFTITFFAIFAISPTLNTIGELLRTIEDQEEVLGQLRKKSAALATVQNEYAVAGAKLNLLEDALPEEQELDNLLLQIEYLASIHQLVITNAHINDSITISSEETETDELQEFSMTVSLESDYSQLQAFITDLEKLPRLVSIDSIKFSEPKILEDILSDEALHLAITISAFYLPMEEVRI